MSSLSFVSWNLAMLERSDQAPPHWSIEHSEAEVRSRILEAEPDIVCFQELPGLVPYVETHSMVRANPQSHQGHLATLVRTPLMDPAPAITSIPGTAVLARFGELTIANVHLAPGPGGAQARLEQIRTVVDASTTDLLVVIGDTNTRVDEVAALADLGLRGAAPPRPTWNSRKNRFHEDTAAFTSYFTRWFATDGAIVDELEVWDRPIIDQGHRFHVSDHYALTGTITI